MRLPLSPYHQDMSDRLPDTQPNTLAAIVVAGGRGSRAGGDIPKQYNDLGGIPVIARTIAALDDAVAFTQIIVVIHPDDSALFAAARPETRAELSVVTGGASRDASVRAGLAALSEAAELVLIHDAARPLVSREVIHGVLDALQTHDGAAPALAVTDALWRGDGIVTGTQAREGLWRAQTPQGFHIDAIRRAHDAHAGGAADDVEVARAAGLRVAITQGDEANLKITRREDFARAAQYLERAMDIRTGNGFDVHAFGEGDHVMLCGIAIPHERGLKGHSDADVGLHTLTDAIYGALAEGDIGTHFPPSDPQWKGAESHIFLSHAVDLAASKGFTISNADLTLICEEPKIGPHASAMRARLAELLRIDLDRISVKATTTERLGFTGRKEGIAAMASVTLVKP